MPQINQLSALDQLAAGDQFPVYSQANGDARKVALSILQAYMQNHLVFPTFSGMQEYSTQYASPSSTGFNVQITNDSNNTHLILTPTAGLAAGTITLPLLANVVDKQEVLVNCTQQITSLTINGNGAVAVTGEPTSLGADDFFRLKFDIITQTWYRVG